MHGGDEAGSSGGETPRRRLQLGLAHARARAHLENPVQLVQQQFTPRRGRGVRRALLVHQRAEWEEPGAQERVPQEVGLG